MCRSRPWPCAVVLLVFAVHATAAPVPCAARKTRAVARHATLDARCSARALARGAATGAACAARATRRLRRAVDAAEKKSVCLTRQDSPGLGALVDGFIADVTALLSAGGPLAGGARACAAAKLAAAGRAAGALGRCAARAARKGGAADAACLARAEKRFVKALQAADRRPGCRTTGDATAVGARVDAFFAALADELGGVFALGAGTTVRVGGDGAVALALGDRTVFAIPAGTGPVVRTFAETIADGTALYTISRTNEIATVLARLIGTRRDGNGVVVEVASADGGVGASLTIAPRTAESSLVRLALNGDAMPQSIAVPIRCDAGGTFHGFGLQYDGTDHRGEALTLLVSEQGIGRDPTQPIGLLNGGRHTTYFPMPYFLDARGHGALLLTDQRVEVDACRSDPAVAWLEVVDDAPIELVVFHGPTPLDVIRQLGDEVGRPRRPPSWAYAPWIASQGGNAAVTADVDALEAAGIPAGVLWVQDWTGIRMNFDGGFGVQYRWLPDETLYPDLPGLIAGFATRGYRFLGYANPFVAANLQHFQPMADQGLLITKDGAPYTHVAPNGGSSHPDLSLPGARDFVKGFLRDMVTVYGMDGWMADFGEWLPLDAAYADGGDPVAHHNRYPVDWHALSTEVMDEVRPDGDWVVFTRSGWTGDQAVSQIHWVGDQEATWSTTDGLPTVVPAMLSLGLAGIPYVTHDIAGFSGGPSTKELYLRWTELGAFTPYMRTHQGNRKTENWSWKSDAETSAHFAHFARVHLALVPELQALAAEAATTSAPIVRHLLLAFPDDPGSRGVSDQFLLGDALLVAPVVTESATTRDVYLPPGTWFHVWTGTPYAGPATVTVDAPIGAPPVFSRDVDRPDLRTIP